MCEEFAANFRVSGWQQLALMTIRVIEQYQSANSGVQPTRSVFFMLEAFEEARDWEPGKDSKAGVM